MLHLFRINKVCSAKKKKVWDSSEDETNQRVLERTT